MNFFEHQDIARRNTRRLVVMFAIAVVLLILLTNLAVAIFLHFSQGYSLYSGSPGGLESFLQQFSIQRFAAIGLSLTLIVALVVLIRWIQLATGGKQVAEGVGGSRVLPQTRDPLEKRCLNVVEEMALAAGMPVPPVYVMNDERGINAFAAGISPADAVIAVTRGTLVQLERDELQGVIAHEFSHILNGDMRLNIRLAAMLKGITFVGDVGYFLMRGSGRRHGVRSGGDTSHKNAGQLMLLGVVFMLLGWLGGLAAGFIKAAISREKEYLADASAVQFTRSNEGIARALKVIGGYVPGTLVHAARAMEMSHIFFGQIEHNLWQIFATHPPLDDRIRRLDPQWSGQYLERKPQSNDLGRSANHSGNFGAGRAAIATAVAAAVTSDAATGTAFADVGEQSPVPPEISTIGDARFEGFPNESDAGSAMGIPVLLSANSHEPLGAQALALALLMTGSDHQFAAQRQVLVDAGVPGLVELTVQLSACVRTLKLEQRLPVLDMCFPALKAMSEAQYRRFKHTLLQLIRADRRTDLFEWCLFQLVRYYLDPEFIVVKPSRPRYRSLNKVKHHLRVVLSVLAHHGAANQGQHAPEEYARVSFARGTQALGLSKMAILPIEECSVAAFGKSVRDLADCYPLLKPRVLKSMSLAAGEDGSHSALETEIIAAVAAVMDCPLPPLMR